MTGDEMRDLASRLSNVTWCRHWVLWGYPQMPARMALSLKDSRGRDDDDERVIKELSRRGFVRMESRGAVYWVIERTNEEGSPYEW